MSKATDFIKKILPYAKEACAGTKIPAGLITAQAGTEASWGSDRLVKYNNLFGVKAYSNWKGKKVSLPADGGICNFRWYENIEECFKYQVILLTSDYYAYAYKWLPNDIYRYIKELQSGPNGKDGGYCTNKRYADDLIEIMEDFKLMNDYELERTSAIQRLEKTNIIRLEKPEDIEKLVPKDELCVILCRIIDAQKKGVKI